MNEDELNKALDGIGKIFEDGQDLYEAHDTEKILESLSPSHKKDLTTLTDVTFGTITAWKYGFVSDELIWAGLLSLALVAFDLGKDAG